MVKNNEPIIKADDFVDFENEEKPEKFTNFQELSMKFEVLKDVVQELTEILRENNLIRKTTIEAPYFEDDELYRRLDNEE